MKLVSIYIVVEIDGGKAERRDCVSITERKSMRYQTKNMKVKDDEVADYIKKEFMQVINTY